MGLMDNGSVIWNMINNTTNINNTTINNINTNTNYKLLYYVTGSLLSYGHDLLK